VDLATVAYQRPHRLALVPALLGALLRGSVLGAIGTALRPWGLVLWLAVPIALAFAVLDFRQQGFAVTAETVVVRVGWWNRNRYLLLRRKLQSVSLAQGPVLRAAGLAVLVLRAAGSTVTLPAIAADDARRLLAQLIVIRPLPPRRRSRTLAEPAPAGPLPPPGP
jgi:uncharacterized membrane protein YdbT with pleckstrin-like domain